MMRRLLLTACVLGCGCGSPATPPPPVEAKATEPGGEMMVYDPKAPRALCWLDDDGKSGEMTWQDVGSKVQFLGAGFKVDGSVMTRVRFLEGEGKGKVGFIDPDKLKSVPK